MTDRDQPVPPAPEAEAARVPPAKAAPAEAGTATPAGIADTVAPETRKASLNLTYGLVALVVFLAGIAVWPLAGRYLEPYLPAGWRADPVDLSAIEARLAALEAKPAPEPGTPVDLSGIEERLAALETRPAPEAARAVDLAPLQQSIADEASARNEAVGGLVARIDALAAAVAALPTPESSVSGAEVDALVARLKVVEGSLGIAERAAQELQRIDRTATGAAESAAGLEGRIAVLEQRLEDTGQARRRQGLVLALGQLAGAVEAGRPYADELQRLANVADTDPEVEAARQALSASASDGVATLTELRRRFRPLAGAVVRAGAAPAADGWLDRAADRLRELVTVRRVGEVEGDDTDAIVARAERRLDEGDLAAAVAELQALQGAAAATAADWRQAAEARLAADAALARLQARAIALVGQG